jgi:archaellin
MNQNEQIEIDFLVTAVPANTRMTMEMRPSVGASLPFAKTAPATITKTNVLY